MNRRTPPKPAAPPAAPAVVTAPPEWTVEDAREMYGFDGWGHGFFSVNKEGETTVRLQNDGDFAEVSLMKIIRGLLKKNKNFHLPALFRFPDLLYARIKELNETFREEIRNQGYKGRYRGVYPIKVNQQQQVVKEVCEYGRKYHHGIEVGSKPELLAALAFMHDREALLICNGYKDAEFIDLALQAKKLGLNVVIVLEMPPELPLILERSKAPRAADTGPRVPVTGARLV